MRKAVDVDGRLTLVDPEDRPIAIEAHGASVDIGFPDLASARQAHAAFTRRTDSNRAIGLLQREMQRTDLALRFRVGGVTVAHLSGQSRGNLLGRALRLNGTEVRLTGVLRAWLRW
jgi:hypothetical protein